LPATLTADFVREEQMTEDITEADVIPEKSNRRTMMIGGVSAVLLGCCALLFILIIGVVVDPLDLNILSRLNGRYDAAATVMPADTAFYAGVNVLNLNPEEIGRITRPFFEAAGDPQVEDLDGAQNEFTDGLESEFGINFEADVMSWLGQYIGFGVTEITFDDFSEVELVSFVIAVEVRDKDKADQFLIKFRDGLAESSGNVITEQSYEGIALYVMQGNDPSEQFAFGRSDSLFILGSNVAAVQSAINAQNGDSLDESEGYKQIIGDLPRGRVLTVYTQGEQIRDLLTNNEGIAGVSVEADSLPLLGFVSAATTFSIIEAGLQIDTFTYTDPAQLTTTQRAMFDATGQKRNMVDLLSPQTVAYFTGQRLDLLWLTIREATGDEVSFDESMEGFGREFGINPNTELFPLFDGDWAIGLVPTQSGLLAEELEIPLGLLFVAETERPQLMAETVEALRDGLEGQQLVVNETDVGGVASYAVSLGEGASPAIYFGLEQSYFYLASSSDAVQDTFATEASLAQSERYQLFQEQFSRDINLAFFVDVRNLLGTIRESRTGFDLQDFNDSVETLQPIEAIGLGNAYDGDIRRTQIIIFIETE
jgi:hypothetical protein